MNSVSIESHVKKIPNKKLISNYNKFECDDSLANELINNIDNPPYPVVNFDVNLVTHLSGGNVKNKWKQKRVSKDKEIISLEETNKPTIVLNSKNKLLTCLLDSGSDRCLIKYETLQELNETDAIAKLNNTKIRGVGGSINVIGETELIIKLPDNDNQIKVKALVIKGLTYQGNIILGRDVFEREQVTLNFKNNTVTINDNVYNFMRKRVPNNLEIGPECLISNILKRNKKRLDGKNKNNIVNKIINESQHDNELSNNVNNGQINDNVNKIKPKNNNNILNKKGHGHSNKNNKPKINKLKNCNDGHVHICCDIMVPAQTMMTISAFAKVDVGEYIVNKRPNNNGLLIAETLCFIEEDKKVPVAVLNMTSEDILIKSGTILTNVNKLNDLIDSYSIITDNVEDCVRNNLNSENPSQNLKRVDSNTKSIDCPKKSLAGLSARDRKVYRDELSEESFIASESNSSQSNFDKFINANALDVDPELDKNDLNKLIKLLNNYRDVLSLEGEGIGCSPILKHKIELKSKETIINTPPYRIPHKYQGLIDVELSKMKDQGLIRESISPFNSPCLVVKKKNGDIRLVIDFRNINKEIIVNTFALPKIDDILNSVGKASVFTTLDLKSAFHHVELNEESKPLTAFTVGNFKYEYNRLPFGLATSPSIFQCLMARALGNLLGVIAFCYIDDIIIYSENMKDHFEDLEKIFSKIREADLRLSVGKCQFMKPKVNYLGFTISRNGVSYEKNEKLANAGVPKNVKELQQFLGICNYYRKFIPSFAEIAKPLYLLLRKEVPYKFDENTLIAFNKLKELINSENVLAHPDFSKKFYLFTDASNTGMGAVLMQPSDSDDKVMRPVSYYSKTLSKTQQLYSTTKKECLALVSAIKHFQFIICGYQLTVLTDHRPLTYMLKRKLPTDAAMARWCLSIQAYDLTLKYFPGKLNVVADYLSRLPEPLTERQLRDCELLVDYKNDNFNEFEEEDFDCFTAILNDKEKPLTKFIPQLEEISWTIDELKKAQKNDSHYKIIIDLLTGNSDKNETIEIKDLDSYVFLSNILYKQRAIDNRELRVLNVCVPDSLLEKAIKSIHYTNHDDHTHTLFNFQFRYYHPREKIEIRNYVAHCECCKILKGRIPKPINFRQAPTPERPFTTVSIDFVGPLIKTDNNNKYILCIIDLYSRFCILEATSSKDSNTVIKALKKVFDQFGYPDTLISDNALEFTSSGLYKFVEIHSIHKTEVLTYAAWSNGIVERNNGKINKLLKLYVNSINSNWDEYLSTCANTINNSLNETLQDTPAYTLFNYDTCPNIQRTSLKDIYNYDSLDTIVTIRERKALQISNEIHTNIEKQRIKQLEKCNKKTKDRIISKGDRVLIKNHQKAHKLDLNYFGPGTVIRAGH